MRNHTNFYWKIIIFNCKTSKCSPAARFFSVIYAHVVSEIFEISRNVIYAHWPLYVKFLAVLNNLGEFVSFPKKSSSSSNLHEQNHQTPRFVNIRCIVTRMEVVFTALVGNFTNLRRTLTAMPVFF